MAVRDKIFVPEITKMASDGLNVYEIMEKLSLRKWKVYEICRDYNIILQTKEINLEKARVQTSCSFCNCSIDVIKSVKKFNNYCSEDCKEKFKSANIKGFPSQFPFEGYTWVNKFFQKKMQRWNVIITGPGKKALGMLYSRYLMSVKLGRLIDRKIHVDHINGDPLDDRIENLQLLQGSENQKKYFIQNNITVKKIDLVCSFCNNNFLKNLRDYKAKEGITKNFYCSTICYHSSLKGVSTKK